MSVLCYPPFLFHVRPLMRVPDPDCRWATRSARAGARTGSASRSSCPKTLPVSARAPPALRCSYFADIAAHTDKPEVLFEWDAESEAFAWTAAGEPVQVRARTPALLPHN